MRTRLLNPILRSLVIASIWFVTSITNAQVPQSLNYQGYLTNAANQPVNAAVNITFRLYTSAAGGAPVWQETQSGIGVANGVFTTVLGSTSALGLPFNVPYFLSLQVNTDAEMAVRQPLSAVPYALRSVSADSVAATATIPATQLSGTLASSQLPATQLLPTTACAASQFSQWNGTAWICAAGTGTSTTSDVTGNLTMLYSTATTGNILKGGIRFLHNFGDSNTFIGLQAGNFTMAGVNNSGSGAAALASNTTGYDNTANGTNGLLLNKTGNANTAVGSQSLTKNNSGSDNTAIGQSALSNNVVGNNNIALGSNAGVLTTGSNNIAIGHLGVATESNTIRLGDVNQARAFIAGVLGVTPGGAGDALLPVVIAPNGQFGTLPAFPGGAQGPAGPAGPQGPIGPAGPPGSAGSSDITGNLTMVNSTATAGNIMKGGSRFIHNFGIRNTFIGELAGNFVLTGSDNAGVGNGALVANTSGAQNTASGAIALLNNKSGNINTAIGNSALLRSESGDYNTAVGYNAGSLLTTGSNNIYLGNFGSAIESGTIHIGTGGIHLKTFAAGIRGVAPGVADALPVVIDSNGQLGTGSVAGAGVTNIATGAGLSGGPITSTGTINLTATQLLPTVACAANQFPQWSGMAWICATGTGSSTTSDVTGNLTMVNSTATAGNILKGGKRFIHNFGTLNTFIGEFAGNFVMTGSLNTGSGSSALLMNTSGEANTAHGYGALQLNQTGSYNTAIGHVALGGGNSGDFNTASGGRALYGNTTGIYNTANGYNALANNTTGFGNTALGLNALESNVAGNNNIAIGSQSGNLLTGNNNIAIGSSGVAGESGTLRIGAAQSKTYISGIYGSTASGGAAVFANSAGQLGTISSSRRYKDEIADMDAASSALMRLRPVTFHYKTDQNSAGRTLQYGLIAEEVAEIYPGLIAHSADGKIETVMYQHLPPMLLNEVQKQQRTIEAQAAELAQQRARIVTLEAQAARFEMIERKLNGIRERLALD